MIACADHTGRSCDDHTKYLAAKHCRFCSDSLTPENTDANNKIKAFENICTAELCLQRRENACEEMLGCGHPCPGVRGEKEHVSCLLEECAKLDPSLRVCSTDLCSICWVEVRFCAAGSALFYKLWTCGTATSPECEACFSLRSLCRDVCFSAGARVGSRGEADLVRPHLPRALRHRQDLKAMAGSAHHGA